MALPEVSSAASNSTAARAFRVKVAGPWRVPASSMAWISTKPDSSLSLSMRSKPCGAPAVAGITNSGSV